MNLNNEINSHIQMPRLLLKRFHNQNKSFYYYDVNKDIIGTKGTAKSMNTEYGYYSEYTEKWLGENIETPFGEVLKYLETVNFDDEIIIINSNIEPIIRHFIYSLISRDPEMLKKANTHSAYMQFYEAQYQHDYCALFGIEFAKEHEIYSDYIVTFLINRTNVPFVLPICGAYSYKFNKHNAINLPISPDIAIALIHNSYSDRVINKDGNIALFTVNNSEDIEKINLLALLSQKKRKWGYVISTSENEIKRLVNVSKQLIYE